MTSDAISGTRSTGATELDPDPNTHDSRLRPTTRAYRFRDPGSTCFRDDDRAIKETTRRRDA